MTSVTQPASSEEQMECSACPLAVYCFSDPSTWVFRTMAELEEKTRKIRECAVRKGDVKATR
ncbi:hypothetical protein EDC27_1463 [Desulfosoma caldarium]|uniref:Uncharacterized protein n=1 Tax=Desulfosoma caldarium TaxID=610254 RepID=A0A3N1UQR4_9BACT|nr:hypothetical protein EDC27_1463 [Desulfosoma caldarium]